mgnify:CR=1 FL=1
MGKARILIVDDTPTNLEILSEILMPEYDISVAITGFEAVELAGQEEQPDLILLDIMMPEMDGYQVCRVLKQQESTKDIPIIFVTSMDQTENEEQGLALGAVDYITKPVNPPVVLARIKTHLTLNSRTRLLQELVSKRTQELETALEEAQQANRAKSSFLSNMSHELRTPLNGIMGMTQLLRETQTTAEQRDFLQDAYDSTKRLLSMVNDLLQLSEIEAGRMTCISECHSFRESLWEILSHYEKRAVTNGLDFQTNIADTIPDALNLDMSCIRQVFINILNNAIKFTREGGITVTVEGKPTGIEPDSEVMLMFYVHNTGVGIPPDKQDSLFDSFSIGEDYMTKEYSGAGLGLAISKHLVELMGGTIWMVSGDPNNVQFNFTVPCTTCTPDSN